jgi:predicted 3-demethylubiquinone-9 3-methyltransferase (glyoxalase superfamily)
VGQAAEKVSNTAASAAAGWLFARHGMPWMIGPAALQILLRRIESPFLFLNGLNSLQSC